MANKNLLVAGVAYTSLLTTELNSVTDGSSSTASSAVVNSTNLNLFMDISIKLASFTSVGASPYVEIRKLELIGDGSSYDDNLPSAWIGRIDVTTGASAKIGSLIGVPLTVGSFKLICVNHCGANFASSGSILYYRTYSIQNNG